MLSSSDRPRRLAPFVLLAALGAAAVTSFASPAKADDDEATRLGAAGHVLRWNQPLAQGGARYGHAEVLVNASIGAVRAQVTDYGHYKDFTLPGRFKTSKVIGHKDGGTDVYMQVPILDGLVTLWDVTRFSPPRAVAGGAEIVEGRQAKGNLKDLHIVWTMRAVSTDYTVLKCDLLIEMSFAVPQPAIDEGLRDACGDGIEAVMQRTQGHKRVVPFRPDAVVQR